MSQFNEPEHVNEALLDSSLANVGVFKLTTRQGTKSFTEVLNKTQIIESLNNPNTSPTVKDEILSKLQYVCYSRQGGEND